MDIFRRDPLRLSHKILLQALGISRTKYSWEANESSHQRYEHSKHSCLSGDTECQMQQR